MISHLVTSPGAIRDKDGNPIRWEPFSYVAVSETADTWKPKEK